MSEDPFDITRRSTRGLRSDDDTQLASRGLHAEADHTQIAAPRVLHSAPPVPELDRSEDAPVELPREHYGIRPVPTQFGTEPVPPTEGVVIPVVDVEAAQARVRRARLLGVIAVVTAMIAVVVLAGVGLAWLL